MMREIGLRMGAACRVWVNEPPSFRYVPEEFIARKAQCADGTVRNFTAAIEVMIGLGGRMLYGGLGAEFQAGGAMDSLEVQVGILEAETSLYTEALPGRADDVFVGLNSEYAHVVMDGVEDAQKTLALPSGKLKVIYGCHGIASSNVPLFHRLGRWIVATRGEPDLAFDEKLIRDIVLPA